MKIIATLAGVAAVAMAMDCSAEEYYSPNMMMCMPKKSEGQYCNTVQTCKSEFECSDHACTVAVVPPAVGGPVDCSVAQVQAPRNVTAGSVGLMNPRVQPQSVDTTSELVHVNTHYHHGAEHYSKGAYDSPDAPVAESSLKPGWFCSATTETLPQSLLEPYDFQHCEKTYVGNTYEFHWVYSTGGTGMGPGLGGAFALQHNPQVTVRAQVFVVVNSDDEYEVPLLTGADFLEMADSVHGYVGSTTGPSFSNEGNCSPYSVTWQVDPMCHLVSAKAIDDMCAEMHEMGMKADAHPHGSRDLVSERLSSSELLVLYGQ